jgi:uncharacterized protein (DUF58 family)
MTTTNSISPQPGPPAPSLADEIFGRLSSNSILAVVVDFYLNTITPAGRWFLMPTILFGALGSVSLENQIHVAFLFAAGLWLIAFALMFTVRKCRIVLRVNIPERVAVGEEIVIRAELVNTSPIAMYDVQILPYHWPKALAARHWKISPVGRLAPKQSVTRNLPVMCRWRGVYQLPGLNAVTSYPLGLLNASTLTRMHGALIVYPKFTPLLEMRIQSGQKYHAGGVALASDIGDSFEYIGNREYREGDNIRDLDWNATARVGRPIVREYRQEYFHRVAVILDTHIPAKMRAADRPAFENAVSLTAAVGDYMARQEYLVDIFAAGETLYHLAAGRSLAYLDQILDILACVEDSPKPSFETLEQAMVDDLSQITTIVCVFLDWTPAHREFVRQISYDGAAVKVIVSRNRPTTLPVDADETLGFIPVIDELQFKAGVTIL